MLEHSGINRRITLRAGNIYLSRELCDAYFRDSQSVALLWREQQLMILPLMRESGGGLLLKVRNLQGDRVVHAQEFFRDKGLPEDREERHLPVHWSSEKAALLIDDLPCSAG